MTTQSAVDFPGTYRLHVALNVSNIEISKRFYEILFGEAPSKERPRYAKFEPTDPSVNLSLNEIDGPVTVEGGSAHFGIQVKSVEAVHAAIEKFKAAGIPTITEEATTCCYAVQDKVWAIAKDELYAKSGCCGPEIVSLNACNQTAGH